MVGNFYLFDSQKNEIFEQNVNSINLGLGVIERFFHSIHFIKVIIVLLVQILLQTRNSLILQTLEGVINISGDAIMTSYTIESVLLIMTLIDLTMSIRNNDVINFKK